jgi:uncharacterized protein YutE (UPF0331/DUF86 family)
MDRRVVSQKIDNLINCLNRLDSRMPNTAKELTDNYDIQDIASVNLERAIQSCIAVAAHLLGDYDDVRAMTSASLFFELAGKGIINEDTADRLSKSVGFRNLLVHRYTDIDWARVYGYLTGELSVFKQYVKQIGKFCGIASATD